MFTLYLHCTQYLECWLQSEWFLSYVLSLVAYYTVITVPRPLRLLTVVSAGQVGAALHADGELGGAGLGAQARQQREADRGRTLLRGYILSL